MANYFVSYDLMSPGQNYDKVTDAIKGVGAYAKVHYSLWYVKSSLAIADLAKRIWSAMDSNDKLVVIDAANAHWYNLPEATSKFIQEQWNR